MTNPEYIERLLNKYNISLKELPTPTEKDYAYERRDREYALERARDWQGFEDKYAMEDFICHQSDVIEMLILALVYADRRANNDVERNA